MRFFIVFCTLFSVFLNNSWAKSGGAYKTSEEKIVDKLLSDQSHIVDTKIKPFDFENLFKQAESYFHLAKSWKKLKCYPKSGFLCTKHECKKRDIHSHIILDKDAKTITRCDNDFCETIKAQFDQTGVFINVKAEGPVGTLIRILADSRYKEINTVGLDAYITNGNCEVLPE